jgi:gentisate 1,2-dioxygenase
MKPRTTGTVRATVEGQPEEDLRCGDALAVPAWHANTLHSIKDANLLRVTDEPILACCATIR